MLKTPIYLVNLTTLKFHKSDSYPDYSADQTSYIVHDDETTSVHLSLKDAEARKDALIERSRRENQDVFSIVIDEYYDGAIILDKLPVRRRVYDKHGKMIELSNNEHGSLVLSSPFATFSEGDIVEVLCNGILYLGIVLAAPHPILAGCENRLVKGTRYTVLTGPYWEDIGFYNIIHLRQYEGDPNATNFIKYCYSLYPHGLLPYD